MSDTPRTNAHYGRLPNDRQTRGSVQNYEHARQLERELAEKEAALAGCVDALRTLENSDCRAIGKTEKCAHGKYGWEDCETCFADFACTVLTSLPESVKQDAEILRTANDLAAADSKESAVWNSEPFNADAFSTASRDTQDAFLVLCQAVRAREGK